MAPYVSSMKQRLQQQHQAPTPHKTARINFWSVAALARRRTTWWPSRASAEPGITSTGYVNSVSVKPVDHPQWLFFYLHFAAFTPFLNLSFLKALGICCSVSVGLVFCLLFDYQPIGSFCTAETQYVVCFCPVVLTLQSSQDSKCKQNDSGIQMLVSHGAIVIILHTIATSHKGILKQS
jgi:hypothetical protein